MNKLYNPTSFEKYVSNFFQNLFIKDPWDINEKYIARQLNIELVYSQFKPYAKEEDEIKIININKNSPKKIQREQFYHELNHLLRHAGDQLFLPKTFSDWQEWDCKNFMLYASVPFHMIKYINEYDNSKHLSDIFGVTENLIVERLQQIKRRREMFLLESRNLQTCIN